MSALANRIVKLSFMLFIIVALSACGGGGGGGGSDSPYTGITEPAAVTESNGVELATSTYEFSESASSIGVATSVNTDAVNNVKNHRPSRPIIMVNALESALESIGIGVNQSNGIKTRATYTLSETIQGDCGGEFAYSISYDDVTGEFSGNINFNDFCSEGTIIQNSASFSGKLDVDAGGLLNAQFSFDAITFTSSDSSLSFTANGDISIVKGASDTVTANMYLTDNVSSKVFWLEDLQMTITDGGTYTDIAINSGQFYNPDYGYVEVNTTTSFRFESVDSPSQGVLVVTGDNSRARLTVLSTTQYQVEIDVNGDGTYEYNSGPLSW